MAALRASFRLPESNAMCNEIDWQWVEHMCWAAASTVALVVVFAICTVYIISRLMRTFGRTLLAGVFAIAFLCIGWLYGGSKTGVTVRYMTGLRDNGTYGTNDTTMVFKWVKDGIVYVPDYAAVFFRYCPTDADHDEDGGWNTLGMATVGDYTATFETPDNVTNYIYEVVYDYVPPTPVQTNGVWKYETSGGVVRTNGESFVHSPVGSRVTGDGNPITPIMQGETEK